MFFSFYFYLFIYLKQLHESIKMQKGLCQCLGFRGQKVSLALYKNSSIQNDEKTNVYIQDHVFCLW